MWMLGFVVLNVGSWELKRFVTTKQQELELNDERNIKVREKSAYNTFYTTLLCLIVAIGTFIVLEIWLATFIISGALAVHVVSYFAFRYINNKKL
jgi:uncharacterized membrane protein